MSQLSELDVGSFFQVNGSSDKYLLSRHTGTTLDQLVVFNITKCQTQELSKDVWVVELTPTYTATPVFTLA